MLLLLLIVLGGLYFFWRNAAQSQKTIELMYGELDLSADFTALTVRNEKVVYALSSGRVRYLLNEGDFIEKGDVVLEIELDDEIAASDKNDKKANLAVTRRALLSELSEIRKSILVDIQKNRMEEAAAKKNEFIAKSELLEKIGECDSSEESAKENVIGKNLVSVYSSLQGVLSFGVDGLETVANPNQIYSFDFSKMDAVPHRVNVARDSVAKGDDLYKVIDASNVLIAVKIPFTSRAETFVQAEHFVVSVGNQQIEGVLQESFVQGDSTVCIIRLNASFPAFFTSRTVQSTISPKGYKGLIVPSTALTEVDGVKGVYRVNVSGFAEFVPVKVLKNESGSAIIQNNRFYDSKGELIRTVVIGQRVVRNASDYKEGDPVE